MNVNMEPNVKVNTNRERRTQKSEPRKGRPLDIDGTLVDSNDAHAHAWVKAFAEAGIDVEFQKVRCAIGMGGDKLMPAVARIQADSLLGRRISARRGEIFKAEYLPQLSQFRGASALVSAIQARGFDTVAASSAKRDELEALLKIAGALSLLSDSASGDDAEQSKPDPNIIDAALKKTHVRAADALMIGDTPTTSKPLRAPASAPSRSAAADGTTRRWGARSRSMTPMGAADSARRVSDLAVTFV